MKKQLLSLLAAGIILSSCQEYRTYIPPYEFRISKESVLAIEDGHILYYDTPPLGSLDGLGVVMMGGRAGYSGEYIADTNNLFFKNAAKKYEQKIFHMLPEKYLLSQKHNLK